MATSRRFTKDLQKFLESNFEKDGIFIHVDEANLLHIKAMIVGNEGTPYEDGFHFFDINVPETYPMDPPKVKYMTGDGRTRFNPNLYVEGKVCLSIINTWSGPKWSPIMTFGQVLLSIKSMILIENPLTNEPGYENTGREQIEIYNKFIRHQNLKVACFEQLLRVPHGFEMFENHMFAHFGTRQTKIHERILSLKDTENNARLHLDYGSVNCLTNYNHIESLFAQVSQKMSEMTSTT